MSFIVSKDTTTLKKYVPADSDTFPFESVVCDVTVPGTFTTIGKEAFYETYDVKTVIIEEGVTKIGVSAFCACGMQEITLPASLEKIAYDAFSHCQNLKRIVLPDGLKKIGKSPFTNTACDIVVSENNNLLKTVDRKLFSKDGKNSSIIPLTAKKKSILYLMVRK